MAKDALPGGVRVTAGSGGDHPYLAQNTGWHKVGRWHQVFHCLKGSVSLHLRVVENASGPSTRQVEMGRFQVQN